MINRKNKKAFQLIGEHGVNLIIAVLCIIILIILGVGLYNFFLGEKAKTAQAKAELEQIGGRLQYAAEQKKEITQLVTTIQNWYFFSEEYGRLCSGEFCLCVCKNADCSGNAKACIFTDKFVLIRKNNIEARVVQLNSPYELKLNLVDTEVYPFNAAVAVKDYSTELKFVAALVIPALGVASVAVPWDNIQAYSSVTPLFLKFDKSWQWSPDLINWMSPSTTKVTAGEWKNKLLYENNAVFIETFKQYANLPSAETLGEGRLSAHGAHLSKGVYTIGV